MTNHLVVFAKDAQPGAVKTRLCPPLTPDEAARLAEAFLRDVLATAEQLADVALTLAYAPRGARERMGRLAGPRWRRTECRRHLRHRTLPAQPERPLPLPADLSTLVVAVIRSCKL